MWKSIKDELPPDEQTVFLRVDNYLGIPYKVGHYDKSNKKFYAVGGLTQKVTHWTPLTENSNRIMPKYYLDIDITETTGFQTYSVEAGNLEEAKRMFLTKKSMKLEHEELDVEGLEELDEQKMKEIYQEENEK